MSTTLKEAVTSAIALRSSPLAITYHSLCPTLPASASEKDQIHSQNQFWRGQLESLDGIDTTAIREYLVENCDGGIAEWLRLFHTGILPACVSLALPRSIQYGRA
jgi:hypothetical protein